MARLTPGVPAPDIRLNADDGSTVALSDLRGHRVVLYFYPKDDTSGCTTQACEFRDRAADFDDAGARVIGVATTFGPSDVFAWVAEEHCGCRLSVERPWIGPTGSRADVRGTMLATLAQSRADRWIVMDAPGSAYRLPSLGFTYDRLAGVVDAMQSQTRYRPILTYAVPAQGAVVTVYGPAR